MSMMCIVGPEYPTRADYSVTIGELGQAVYVRTRGWWEAPRVFWTMAAAERWIDQEIRRETWKIDNAIHLGVMF